jgi:two-component system NtrC family sensor kinase
VAAVQVEEFSLQFHGIGLDDTYTISLFHLDGTLVTGHPLSSADVGKKFGHLLVFARQLHASRGSFWTDEGKEPGMHAVSYRVVSGAPFLVRVSRSRDGALVEWRRTATGAGVAMLVLSVFLGWLLLRLARDRARRERERQRRAQAEKLEALGQLTGGIAHDFANTLNILALNIALARKQVAESPALELPLANIERAARAGKQLVERLLSFARRRPLTLQRLRLDSWLGAAQPLLVQAAGPRVAIDVEAAAPLAEVLCDTGQLDTVLVNLVINARDAMAGAGRITVRAYPCEDEAGVPKVLVGPAPFVCLSVQDTGPGMPEEVKRRALEPFYTTKGEVGTGLGLSQVYGFMQQVGGSVTIESAPGRGTSVHLFFPVAPAGEAA